MPRFGKTSEARLATCAEPLQMVLRKAIELYDFTVLCGHRDAKEQAEAVARGASNASFPNSRHNSYPSEAVDIAPWPIDWTDRERFAFLAGVMMQCAKDLGIAIRWGNDWNGDGVFVPRDPNETLSDMPHFELVRV